MTHYEHWQSLHYGSILPPGQGIGEDTPENGSAEAEQSTDWTELQAELELKELEN